MTIEGGFATTEDWESDIGSQIRRARLDLDISQEELARRANVSLGAVKTIERGDGSTLKTLIRIVRALGRQDWLAELAPEPEIGPFDLLKLREGRQSPKRASGRQS